MSDVNNSDDFPRPCDEHSVTALRYLDNDLDGQELQDFLLHLQSCAPCRSHLQAEKKLSATLHQSRPLYAAPAELRSRVSAAIADMSAPASGGRPYLDFFRALASVIERIPGWRVLAPAAVAIAVCLAFVPDIERTVRAASYVETAVADHRNYLDGNLPVGLRSGSPEAVTNWLTGRVPFDFHLPAEPAPGSQPAYRVAGASVVTYKGSPAALVMYETQNEKITLLAVSSNSDVVAGGDEVRFGKLIFHYHTNSGFRVITWTNHGLSYALVSSVLVPARQSCLVCHQSMGDKASFKDHP